MAELFRVSLRHAKTFAGMRGVQWRRGQIRQISDPAQVAYYRRQTEFSVEPVAGVAKVAPPVAPAPAPTRPPPAPEPEAPEDMAACFTTVELQGLKKTELIELGAEGFGLILDPATKKDLLIAALLKAQGGE